VKLALEPAAAHKAAAFFVRWQLAIVLLVSPLFLFPSLRLVPFLLVLPLLWIASWRLEGEPVVVTPLNAQLALLSFMVFVSVIVTPDIEFSLPKVAGVLLGFGVFFGVVRALTSQRAMDLSLDLFSFAGGALAIIGILGTNWIVKVSALRPILARVPAVIRGVPGQAEGFQPNAIAGALVMFVPLQFALMLNRKGMLRVLHGIALILTLATLVLTQSRGAWLAFAGALFCWMVWQGGRWRLTAIVAAITGMVIAGIAYQPIKRLVLSHTGSNLQSDISGRLELWSRAIMAIEDFPFTGMGMNTFRRAVMVLYPTFFIASDVDIAHAHNHLLQAAVDLGLPGLIAYIALWMGTALLLVRSYRFAHDSRTRLLVSGMGAGLLAYFLFGTTDAIALGAKAGIFFWIALALVVSQHRIICGEGTALAP
jgi:putative inorganic carbon (HCO3(-)) transporter